MDAGRSISSGDVSDSLTLDLVLESCSAEPEAVFSTLPSASPSPRTHTVCYRYAYPNYFSVLATRSYNKLNSSVLRYKYPFPLLRLLLCIDVIRHVLCERTRGSCVMCCGVRFPDANTRWPCSREYITLVSGTGHRTDGSRATPRHPSPHASPGTCDGHVLNRITCVGLLHESYICT